MRILISDFAGHAFPFQLSRELARSGHSVVHSYFAANDTPMGGVTGDNWVTDLEVRPIEAPWGFKKHSLLTRRASDIAFGRALADLAREVRPDVLLSNSTPLDGYKGLLKSTNEMKIPVVFWLQDVLSIANEFVFRRKRIPLASLVGWHYRRMEAQSLRGSAAIICIAPEFQELMRTWDVPVEHSFVIQNWASPDEMVVMPDRNTAWAREQGLAGKFCYVYSGSLGMKHRPELLLELAKSHADRNDFATVVIAQGAGADWLRSRAHEVRPGALHLLPFQPYDRVPEVLGCASVLIALLDHECGSFAVPSKILAYLCVGRPLLMAAPEQNLAARTVLRANAGVVVGSDDPIKFVHAARAMADDTEALKHFAQNARIYAESTFAIGPIREKFEHVFSYAIERYHGRTVPIASPQNVVGAQ